MDKNQASGLLLDSGTQAIKVRVIFWVVVAVSLLALWGGWAIFQSFGLSQADGGVLKPFAQRLAFGGVVAGLGLLLTAGMLLYMSLYALRIVAEGDAISITTMTPFGGREQKFKTSELGNGTYNHGQMSVDRSGHAGHMLDSGNRIQLKVDAPWLTLRATGHRLPFILDLKAKKINTDALALLAGIDTQD